MAKIRIVRKLFKRFYFPITTVTEEWMQGDPKIGRRRKVDITTLACPYSHIYWQEKNKPIDYRFCDMCFQVWLMSLFKDEWTGKKWAERWDKYLRTRLIGEV